MLINVRDFGKGKQMTGLAIFLVILTTMDLVGYTVNKKNRGGLRKQDPLI